MERAREYDRISELLCSKVSSTRAVTSLDTPETPMAEYGVEARRVQFDKDSYRQPRAYRKGQADPMTDECRTKLQELQDYSLMIDSSLGSSSIS